MATKAAVKCKEPRTPVLLLDEQTESTKLWIHGLHGQTEQRRLNYMYSQKSPLTPCSAKIAHQKSGETLKKRKKRCHRTSTLKPAAQTGEHV